MKSTHSSPTKYVAFVVSFLGFSSKLRVALLEDAQAAQEHVIKTCSLDDDQQTCELVPEGVGTDSQC